MRQVVLVKQVPAVSQLALDAETRTLKREGVRLEVSSFDVRALLRAIDLRAEHGGEVVVMTMGPPSAREALVYCLALGADRGIHGAAAGQLGERRVESLETEPAAGCRHTRLMPPFMGGFPLYKDIFIR